MKKLKWHTEKRKVKDLKILDVNPRDCTDDNQKNLKKSLNKFNLVEIPKIIKVKDALKNCKNGIYYNIKQGIVYSYILKIKQGECGSDYHPKDNFKLIGSVIERISRIGNAVMPNMMKAIAENIKINILDKL